MKFNPKMLNNIMRNKRWYAPIIIVVLVLILWMGEYTQRELWEPDEARYAYVAWEMRDTGSWFIPTLYGEPYPDKPPLLFWLINLSATLFTAGEINGISARLPSMLGSFLSLLTLFYLVRRWHDEKIGWCAVLILTTAFIFWNLGGWARTDALLCGVEMLSLYFFFTAGQCGYYWRIFCAYVFVGFAMLVKGPVGFVVPVGIYAVSELIRGNYKSLKRFHWLWGTLIALLLPGIWLLLAYLNGAPSEYFHRMLGEKLFARVVESKGHAQPFYYFLLHLPVGFMPWSIFIPSVLTALSDKKTKWLVAGWVGFVVYFFSLFVCKRHIYILPVYPALALLVGAGWWEFEKLSGRWKLFTAIVGICLVVLLGAGEVVAYFVLPVFTGVALFAVGVAMVVAGIVLIWLYRRYSIDIQWFYSFAFVLLFHYAFIGTFVLPELNSIKTPSAEFRQFVQTKVRASLPVYIFNDQLAIVSFYAKRHGKTLRNIDELKAVIKKGDDIVLVTKAEEWDKIKSIFPVNIETNSFQIGHKNIIWIKYSNSVTN